VRSEACGRVTLRRCQPFAASRVESAFQCCQVHARGGHVHVRLSSLKTHVEITVEDTGQGISAEFLPHVFDRFRQADGTTTRRHGGLGLGLAIARHLVELHGGEIHVASQGEGRGTTFTVNLPLTSARHDDDNSQPLSPASRDIQLPTDYYATLDGLRVLVVDDETDTRELVAFTLSRCGAEVQTSTTAEEALSTLETWKPDVLVSDIGMPGVDGYEFIRRVRELDTGLKGRIPAVALTAYAGVDDHQRALSAGFQMHLAKPLVPNELVAVVATLAGRSIKV